MLTENTSIGSKEPKKTSESEKEASSPSQVPWINHLGALKYFPKGQKPKGRTWKRLKKPSSSIDKDSFSQYIDLIKNLNQKFKGTRDL